MNIVSRQEGDVTVIRMAGKLDAMSSADANAFLTEELNQKRTNLVIDLTEVDYIVSAGVRCLINIMKLARLDGGDLRLAGVRLEAHHALEMGGLTDVMKVFASVDQAVQSYA